MLYFGPTFNVFDSIVFACASVLRQLDEAEAAGVDVFNLSSRHTLAINRLSSLLCTCLLITTAVSERRSGHGLHPRTVV